MKVAVFTGFFLPHKGGVENYIWEVYRRLRSVQATIVTINTEGSLAEERMGSLRVIRLPGWNIVGRSYPLPKPTRETFKLLRQLWRGSFDGVNTHTRFFLTSLLGLLLAKTKKIPLLHTEHGSGHTKHESLLVEWIELFYDYTFGRLIFRLANKTIGVSRASAAFAAKMRARQPVEYVYNGVDTQIFRRNHTNLKKKLKIPATSLVVTYVGRLMRTKGPDLLVDAFTQLDTDAHLVVIGGGPMLSEIEQLGKGRPRLHILGPQPRHLIPDFLSITDIFVLPTTRHPEGLPTVVLEAGAVGCAVVATDVGGTREIVRHSETGLLTSPTVETVAGALQQLLESPILRRQLAMRLQNKVVKDFNWNKLAPQFYRQLLKTYGQKIRSS